MKKIFRGILLAFCMIMLVTPMTADAAKKNTSVTCKLATSRFTYDGIVKKPKVIVKNSNGKTVADSHYKVTYAKGRKNIGKYQVTVKFNGKKYSGTKKLYFTIHPVKASIKEVTSPKNGTLKITWKKKENVSGYQVRYSLKSDMSNSKTKLISGKSKLNTTISGLKRGKKYYVQVRTYKTVKDIKYYSYWSDKKSKTTKNILSDEEYFADEFKPVLRFAVASDVHVHDSYTEVQEQRLANMFNTIYRYSEDKEYKNVDGAFFAGDFTDRGTLVSMNKFFDIVEANCREETTTRVVLGNHEYYSDSATTVEKFLEASGYETTDEHIVLNGYHFIFVNPDLDGTHFSEATQSWLAKELEEAAVDDSTGTKPIFVFQHEHIQGTVYGSEDWGVPELTHILEQYPQVVDFSGHSHFPISDPRSVWQGTFTALGTGTLNYYEMGIAGVQRSYVFHTDYEGGYSSSASIHDAAQYYIVEVDKNHAIKIQGYDMNVNSLMDNPILLRSVGNPEKFKYTNDRKESSEQPYFPEETKADVENVTSSDVKINFTQAKCKDNVQHYRVELYQNDQMIDYAYRLSCTFYLPVPEKLTATFSDLNPNTEYQIKIIAVSSWEKESSPHLVTFKTATE